MQALVLTSFAAPMSIANLPLPQPGPGQVLVRIAASGVNPLDTKIAAGTAPHARPRLPAILGIDMAGTVAAVGVDPVLVLRVLSVDEVVAEESANTLMAVSQGETGSATSGTICIPPSRLPFPEVLPVLAPVVVAGVDVVAPAESKLPRTLIALPCTVIGAFRFVRTWVPLRMLSVPVVVGDSAALVESPTFAALWVLFESPITLIALPSAVIGAVTAGTIWVPPSRESAPVVLGVAIG